MKDPRHPIAILVSIRAAADMVNDPEYGYEAQTRLDELLNEMEHALTLQMLVSSVELVMDHNGHLGSNRE